MTLELEQRTLPGLFRNSVQKFGANVFLWEKKGDHYKGTTYSEMKNQVDDFSAGLISLGLNKGDRVALISEGRNDWVMSELGILFAGAVNVPISVKINALADLKFRLAHSGCKMVTVSESQAKKIRDIKKDLPDLEKIIVLDQMDHWEPEEIYKDEVISLGKKYLESRRTGFESLWQSIKETDYANICYTSGTTADPKGILLTHRNYTSNIEQSNSLVPCPDWYVTLLILPWDHAFAHTCGIYTMMKNGASMASVEMGKSALETLKNIPKNIQELRPTIMLSVPALAKNFRRNIENAIKKKGAKTEALFRKALKTAYDYNAKGWNRGKGIKRKVKKPLLLLFSKLIFEKIQQNFGGRLEFFVGGGALLDIELQKFFYAIGIPMFQGYGLTEAAPVISSNCPESHKLGSSGRVAENLELEIRDDSDSPVVTGEKGEITVKGENVMAGYWKNEKATQEVLKDGWLHTGDLGYMDEDGFLYVLGRKKSLLIGNDAEKYSPEGIEEAITDNSEFIDQMMLYNNQCAYTVALIVPNKPALLNWLNKQNLSSKTEQGQQAVLNLIQEQINAFTTGGEHEGMFPQRWLPSAVAVLGEPFTEENQMLNSTLKMVRRKIAEFYKNRIDFLYSPEGKDILNHQNRTIVSRFEEP
ncbi:MAG: AMP-binding protein [Candidatus Aminicenantes bacterium]|nr:AMP-binding protein [Candidatus Aminicenantes bacterium]